jgi:glycosyltransferase involved in cell wall biosynthesis
MVMLQHKDEIWLALDSRGVGGIESHVLQLASALSKADRRVRILLLADYGPHPLRAQAAAEGIALESLDGSTLGLWRALRQRRPALLHCHGYKAGILGRVTARLLGVPVVSTFHAGEPGRGRLRVYQWLDEFTGRLAPRLAVSEPIAARLGTGTQILDNFVSLPAASEQAPLSLAFVGRLSHEKGPDRFLSIARQHPNLPCLVFGDGPLREALQAQASSNVQFMGMVNDMPARWSSIGLLCMPSRHEGMPMAALEAMAHGVPLAALEVGGLGRLATPGSGGILCPSGDVASLSEAIGAWSQLSEVQRRQRGWAARQWVAQHFTPEAVLPDILRCYAQAGGGSCN